MTRSTVAHLQRFADWFELRYEAPLLDAITRSARVAHRQKPASVNAARGGAAALNRDGTGCYPGRSIDLQAAGVQHYVLGVRLVDGCVQCEALRGWRILWTVSRYR